MLELYLLAVDEGLLVPVVLVPVVGHLLLDLLLQVLHVLLVALPLLP